MQPSAPTAVLLQNVCSTTVGSAVLSWDQTYRGTQELVITTSTVEVKNMQSLSSDSELSKILCCGCSEERYLLVFLIADKLRVSAV